MQLHEGDAARRKHRKTPRKKSGRKPQGARGPRPHADGAAAGAAALPASVRAPHGASRGARVQAFDIEAELQALESAARAHRKPLHGEAAALVLATAACLLVPSGAAGALLGLQDAAFLAVLAPLAAWLTVRLRRYRQALGTHFDQGLARINRAVADPSERLVDRSRVAKLRAQWFTARKFFEPGWSLFAALALHVAALVAVHLLG